MANITTSIISRRNFLAGLGLAGASAAVLTGCGQRDAAAGGSSSGSAEKTAAATSFSYYTTDPMAIEPFGATSKDSWIIVLALFDPLLNYNYQTGELEGLSAESWESNDDATQWTFHLRSGLKFHDGTDVTASSFKYAWERLCGSDDDAKTSPMSYMLSSVQGYDEMLAGDATELSGVTCPDDLTLQVQLKESNAEFSYICSTMALSPMPDAAKNNYESFSKAPIGNGPFMLDDDGWVDGQYVAMKRFEDYAGPKPASIDEVTATVFKDGDTAFREFEAGTLSLTNIPPARFADTEDSYGLSDDGYTANPGKQVLSGASATTIYAECNVKSGPCADKRVRQALSLALDRDAIVDKGYSNTQVAAGDIVGVGVPGNDESAWTYNHYDKDAAGQLLDEAGYPAGDDGSRGLSLTMMVPANFDLAPYEVMQADWKDVGIDVQIDHIEFSAMTDRFDSGDFDMGVSTWFGEYPTMDNFLRAIFYTGATDNFVGYSNSEFDAKLDEARATLDDGQRQALCKEANAIVAEDMPVIPTTHRTICMVAVDAYQNVYVNPGTIPEFRSIEKA